MILKYQNWYDQIIDRARDRDIPRCYCEWHHIKPRSFGGGDEPSNLVLLTYREHFLVHWLLTKFTTARELRKMQRAMFAMTLQRCGNRIVSGWQFEAAKRAVRDLELDPALEEAWRVRYEAAKVAKMAASRSVAIREMVDKAKRKRRVALDLQYAKTMKPKQLDALANEFLATRRRRRNHPKRQFVTLFDDRSREHRVHQARMIVEAALAE